MEQVRAVIEHTILWLGYPGITLIMLAENLFPPIPSELVMPFAGFLAAQGKLHLWVVIAAGTSGSVAGATVLYYIGRWADDHVVRAFLRRYGRYLSVHESDLDRVLRVFDRFGEPIVFFGRLVPIVRSLISVPAGMRRMPLARFLLFTTLGSAGWTALLASGGFVLAEHWPLILEYTRQYERLALALLVLAGAAAVAAHLWRRRRRAMAAPPDVTPQPAP